MGSPIIWGPNNTASNLENQILQANGSLLAYNGPKNYIAYNNFENNATTGWSLGNVTLTSNFPSGVPTFGSGASGNLSIATVSSGQLAGLYSLSYVSSAATTAGDFVASQAYTIDIEDQAKVLTFKFAYSAVTNPSNCNFSGTSSNSFGVAIYDITNSAWIMPAGVWNLVQSSGVGIATGTFQTPSNMTQFRLVLFNANATAGATTLYLDDFFVGPQVSPLAPAMSDWKNDQTFTWNGAGTVTNNSVYYRRVGDTMEVSGSATIGTVSGTTASLTLPFAIDSTKMTSTANLSTLGYAFDTNGSSGFVFAAGQGQAIFYDGSDTAKVYFANKGTTSYDKIAGSTAWTSNQPITFKFSVPIAGWSSNAVSSADTDTRVVIAQASGSATGGNGAGTAFVFPTVQFDTHAAYNSSTGAYLAPVSGYYRATIAINTSAVQSFYVYVNGSQRTLMGQSVGSEVQGSGVVKVNAGDSITVAPGASVSPLGTGYITFERLSGPAVVQAAESVNARYYSSATSISGSLATITYATKDYDTHNAYSGGTYTVPVTGKYEINAAILITGTIALNNNLIVEIQKNGTVVSRFTEFFPATLTDGKAAFSDLISCNAGDTVRIQVSSSVTGPSIVSSNFDNYFSIFRQGN